MERGIKLRKKSPTRKHGNELTGQRRSTMSRDARMKKIKKFKEKIGQRFFSIDDIFLSRMASILKLTPGTVKKIFSERAVTTIRVNNLIQPVEKTVKLLRNNGFILEDIPWCSTAFIVRNKDKSEMGETQFYKDGLYYIQNLSSILDSIVLEPQETDKILDMCAAPGSKTTHLAMLTNGKAEIVANDNDVRRSRKLLDVLTQYKIKNVQIDISGAEKYSSKVQNYFDKVLLDAPCSGEGMVYMGERYSLQHWNIKKIKVFAKIQKKLIESAYKVLKPGGTMIYSTCTLEVVENEAVINHLLQLEPKAELQQIKLINKPEFQNFRKHIKTGVVKWNEFAFSEELRKCVRVVPSGEMMGFFIAKIKKNF